MSQTCWKLTEQLGLPGAAAEVPVRLAVLSQPALLDV